MDMIHVGCEVYRLEQGARSGAANYSGTWRDVESVARWAKELDWGLLPKSQIVDSFFDSSSWAVYPATNTAFVAPPAPLAMRYGMGIDDVCAFIKAMFMIACEDAGETLNVDARYDAGDAVRGNNRAQTFSYDTYTYGNAGWGVEIKYPDNSAKVPDIDKIQSAVGTDFVRFGQHGWHNNRYVVMMDVPWITKTHAEFAPIRRGY